MKRILKVVAAIICLPLLLSGADRYAAPVINIVAPGPAVSVEPAASCTPEASGAPPVTVTLTPTPQAPLLQTEKLSIKSSYLKKKMKVNVYLPADYDAAEKYPVLYLLHGYRGNENDWENNLSLIDTASELFFSGTVEPYIIVAPDIENSYGVNSSKPSPPTPAPEPADIPAVPSEAPPTTGGAEPDVPTETPASTPEAAPEATPEATGTPAPSVTPETAPGIEFKPSYGRYEDYLIKELIPYIDKSYSTIAQKEGRYIGGLSMGGFAALHLCFAHTGLFSKAGGHSPALWIYTTDPMKINDVITWLYPSDKLRKTRDPLLQANNAKLSGIKIWLDCGTRDSYGFYQGAKKLFGILESRGVQAEYHPFSGGHSNDYWRTHLKEYLIFYGS